MADDPVTADAVETTRGTETVEEAAGEAGETSKAPAKKKSKAKKKTRKKTTRKASAKDAARDDGETPESPEAGEAAAASEAEGERQKGESDGAEGSPGEEAPSGDEAGEPAKPAKKRSRRKKPEAKAKPPAKPAKQAEKDEDAPPPAEGPAAEMIINYAPGEECRIAILEDGKLEEFDSEPTEHVSRVGNIYVGKVVNIESQIQAAFVDFGVEEAGFLHVSDLHPRYFPGADEDETERVGRKTPRRQRPPIQQALKRGQEITVQVLKEGVGTKGPTLTSYISIPGRYLVMMPDMDKVGVSRKVEDEEERRKMRQILDQLELPDGFGFILRTAGMDRNKTELKRDLAYLQRLWKDMERRRRKSGGARLLYSESDLLLRTLRDRASSNITRIVIDNEAALRRAGAFMKIVSPRSSIKVCHYQGTRPIFHAFGIEEQLDLMHATEVPLPSGGRLVIEQTEALVAIDVNSGKSRGARDAETNAYHTNIEAVDEICRQLRLRDLGGLVINDLIDMRHASHRKEIENRFRERLKRDRARSTILPISQFGILEMTRQRMRGSYEQQHYQTCPRCTGRGLIKRPDSVAAGALRDLASLLEHDRVQRVELVVSPLVAGALLSTRRNTLGRIERLSGKKVDVRVSETISAGRFTMYAYDGNGADVDIEKLPRMKAEPKVVEWEDTDLPLATDSWAVDLEDEAETVRKELEHEARAHEQAVNEKIAHLELPGDDAPDEDEEGGKKKRRRRRRRRGKGEGDDRGGEKGREEKSDRREDAKPEKDGRKAEKKDEKPKPEAKKPEETPDAGEDDRAEPRDDGEGGGRKKRRRRRRRRKGGEGEEGRQTPEASGASSNGQREARSEPREEPKPQASKPEPAKPESKQEAAKPEGEPKPRKRRSLYGAGRRQLTPSEKASAERE